MAGKASSFRIGRVQAYLRGQVWYLCYHEQGVRRRPRVGPDKDVARQLAAQINGQIEVGAPAALSFEPIAIEELRSRWLSHHEHVLRSSVQTINRYRTATEHLLNFLRTVRPVSVASHFRTCHAEEFVRYLRTIQVAPNGHANARKRPLLDKGLLYILETCRALFSFAARHRNLSPYAENPFTALEFSRMPVENVKRITLMTVEQEKAFLEACDDWQFGVYATLMLTGMRPGELAHLLLPDDIDFESGLLFVRNRKSLGWRVKTGVERSIPLIPALSNLLKTVVANRKTGPVFFRRRFFLGAKPTLSGTPAQLEHRLAQLVAQREREIGRTLTRTEIQSLARHFWRDIGAIKIERLRNEFMTLTRRIGAPDLTAPKIFRHMFATSLQDANVDPLIRNELMGHIPLRQRGRSPGLGMTATYTHTRPETKLRQLESALSSRAATIQIPRLCRANVAFKVSNGRKVEFD